MDDLKCSGLEKRLDECDHGEWGQTNCAHIEDIGINCTGNVGDKYNNC